MWKWWKKTRECAEPEVSPVPVQARRHGWGCDCPMCGWTDCLNVIPLVRPYVVQTSTSTGSGPG
jgi:hypothetical protein